MNQESLRIILRTYSKGGFNEDEAVQLIEDLYYRNKWLYYIPYTPWPQITYETSYNFTDYKVTCNK